MAAALTADQEVATKAFIDAVSESGAARVSRATAVKFLLARKFDVARAHALWRQHEATRRREGLARFDPLAEPLKSELATGKFTVLQTRDATGAAIAVFTANKHIPSESSHQTTLQGLVYQLDVALQSLETQRAGLVFIYDMTDSKYTNFDYDLSQKILTLLKGGYPAKLKKVLIVTAPLWFKAPFRILRLFVREKLRERVHTVSTPQLGVHVPRAALPPQLGGTQPLDHHAWLLHCLKSFTNSGALVCGAGAGAPGEYASGAPGGGGDMAGARLDERRHAAAVNHKIARDDPDDDDLDISTSGRTTSLWCSDAEQGGSASSGFSDEEGGGAWGAAGGLPPAQFLAAARALGRRGLAREYDEIRARPPAGTFINAKLTNNLAKNRYTDVLCYDHSRVLLSQTDPDDPCSDYVNANYVDGYKQKNAFISTQGPLPKTYSDFWRMVWEQHSLVIVMTTKAVERGRVKCGQYWPIASGQKATYGDFEVLTENVRANQDYVVSDLLVTNIQTEEVRPVSHWQYIRWPDYGVPGGGRAAPVLEFLAGVRAAQATARRRLGDAWAGHSRGPPIVVHCSAGIGRTGTFLTLDICISRLEDTGFIDVRSTVEKIRSQRAYSIQMPDQYIFCHLALIEYAVASGYLDTADWSGFDDDNDEDDDE